MVLDPLEHYHIVILINDWGDELTDSDRAKLETALNEGDTFEEAGVTVNEWTVRGTRQGEAEGTYYLKDDGTLQILGYSIPLFDGLSEHIKEAFERSSCGA